MSGVATAISAGVSIAGSVAGSMMSSSAAKKAGKTQYDAAKQAGATDAEAARQANEIATQVYQQDLARQESLYNQARGGLAPYAKAGRGALNQLTSLMAPPTAAHGAISATAAKGTDPAELARLKAAQTEANAEREAFNQRFEQRHTAVGWDQAQSEMSGEMNAIDAKQQAANQAVWKAQKYTAGTAAQAASAGTPGGELNRDFTAQDYRNDPTSGGNAAPDLTHNFSMADYQADPGYAFRLEQGNQGIEHSAAAQLNQLSGATIKALAKYNSDEASQEYGKAFNRFGQNRENAAEVYGKAFDRWTGQRANQFNRLSSLAVMGQNAATQQGNWGMQYAGNASASGQNYSNVVGSNLTGTAQRQGEYMTQGANALAAGQTGSANAYNQGLGQVGNSLMQYAYLRQPTNYGQTGNGAGYRQFGNSYANDFNF